jgi:hypothetical protein
MAEYYHIGLIDYTIPTIGILIIATVVTNCKTCANFEVYKHEMGRKFIQSV